VVLPLLLPMAMGENYFSPATADDQAKIFKLYKIICENLMKIGEERCRKMKDGSFLFPWIGINISLWDGLGREGRMFAVRTLGWMWIWVYFIFPCVSFRFQSIQCHSKNFTPPLHKFM
jgi:hypothetical protein